MHQSVSDNDFSEKRAVLLTQRFPSSFQVSKDALKSFLGEISAGPGAPKPTQYFLLVDRTWHRHTHHMLGNDIAAAFQYSHGVQTPLARQTGRHRAFHQIIDVSRR